MTEVSNERLAEQGVEVLRRLSQSNISLSDASFIAQWATDVRAALRQSHSTGVEVKGLAWFLGAQNDGLFIIDTPPRPSNDDQWHDRPDGPSLVIPLGSMDRAKAQAIIDAHNSAISGHHHHEANAEADAERVAVAMHNHRAADDVWWRAWEDMPDDYRAKSLKMVLAGLSALSPVHKDGEPVAWRYWSEMQQAFVVVPAKPLDGVDDYEPLYASPPPKVVMITDEMVERMQGMFRNSRGLLVPDAKFCRAVLAAVLSEGE